ncbi:glycerol kinase GlpK [bacterium]|nr:glycerol kinase GlpK [bacterium]
MIMKSQYILAIDQGTTGTTVSLYDQKGQVVQRADQDFEQIFPQSGWVEHRPQDIWQTVLFGIKQVLSKSSLAPHQIAAIGITNQRETVVPWNRATGEPVMNAIVWQCRRTTDYCRKLKPKEKLVRAKTGLLMDPYFSATKMNWILKNNSKAKELAHQGQLCFGTIDSFLISKLTQGKSHKTDPSNASRTLLFNLKKQSFDVDLLKLFNIPSDSLPQIEPSNGHFGLTKGVPGLPDGIPIHGVIGDQQSALFGQAGVNKGDAKITFGTGSFLLFNTGTQIISSKKGLLTTVAWTLKGQKTVYALEGGAFICGAAVQWLRDGLGFIHKSSEVETLARSVETSEGVEFVPALAGLGAPYWQPQARGIITGLSRGTTRAHIARATLEAMALQNLDILDAMKSEARIKLSRVRVDGGATENDLLMQLQADYLGIGVEVPQNIETTSTGAALMAGLGVGLWSLTDLQKVNPLRKKFQSQIEKKQRAERVKRWHKAIRLSY